MSANASLLKRAVVKAKDAKLCVVVVTRPRKLKRLSMVHWHHHATQKLPVVLCRFSWADQYPGDDVVRCDSKQDALRRARAWLSHQREKAGL